jgi:AraC family transcriptional regulator, regulatory protein of adaptative response / methylphosphotriester-DNA alkyltransferase methyltransferase
MNHSEKRFPANCLILSMDTPKEKPSRQDEITDRYLTALDEHLADVVSGLADKMLEINEIAGLLHIHPTHLSNTVRTATGRSACDFFEEKILNISKAMLEKNELNISTIAGILTYDPSNFTKFFKSYMHVTPKQYREAFLKNAVRPLPHSSKTVRLTTK